MRYIRGMAKGNRHRQCFDPLRPFQNPRAHGRDGCGMRDRGTKKPLRKCCRVGQGFQRNGSRIFQTLHAVHTLSLFYKHPSISTILGSSQNFGRK